MARYKISNTAKAQGIPTDRLLIEMFDRYGSLGSVADALGVTPSAVSVAILRAGLKCKVVLTPKDAPGGMFDRKFRV